MRIRKRQTVKAWVLCMLVICMAVTAISTGLEAATVTGQETRALLLDGLIGRYKLNYTGNTNHFAIWNNDGTAAVDNYNYNDVPGWANSSTAALSPSPGTKKIVKAFLMWETRAPEAANSPIQFIAPDGRGEWIYPYYAFSDWRESPDGAWAWDALHCMVEDVTGIVQSAGYGNYSVCNIPKYNGGRGGGESPGSWQLIVVEEGDDFPIRLVSLMAGAEFRADFVPKGQDYTSILTFGSGIKTKSNGNATGQIFFGGSNSGASAAMTEQVSTYKLPGAFGFVAQAVAHTTYTAGLYRNGALVNGRDYGKGCIRMDLSDVDNIGNRAQSVKLNVTNNNWSSFFFLGTAVDIAYPDFGGTQTMTVNDAKSVTVTGQFTNTAATRDTGIYDGRMVVELDSGLTPTSASAVVNGNTAIYGTIDGNTVIFDGSAIASMMNGSRIDYTVQCSTDKSGKTMFHSNARFHGYLRSDGVNTGYWVDRMWTASSKAVPKYRLTVNAGTGIESVTGGGDHSYGSWVNVGAAVKPGYRWVGWTGDHASPSKDFTLSMPAQDLNITAQAEAEVNAYTVAFHPNDGGEVAHLESITTQSDKQLTFPDGAAYYARYTQDGVNVTDQVLSGAISLTAESEEPETETEANEVTPPEEPETDAEADEVTPPEEPETETEIDEVTPPDDTEQGTESGVSVEQTDLLVTRQPEGSAEAGAEESGAERAAEQPEEEPKVYPSVFMGWSLEADKDGWIPQWKAGETIDVKDLAEAAGVAGQNGATVTLYAVWDDCPWIVAEDLYYTLEEAQSGFITEEEILSHALASDREDGSPIAPGFHEDGTSFSIPDYLPTDFTQFRKDGSCTENLTVVDSVGSVYAKQITVHVVDTTAVAVKPEGTTRFINEYYYNQPYEYGGLEDHSIWKTDPAHVAKLEKAFENMRNDAPMASYFYTHETILEMKEYVREHGIGNSREPDALQNFYERFMIPN